MKRYIILLIILLFAVSAGALEVNLEKESINVSAYIQTRYTISPSSTDQFTVPRLRSDIWGNVTENFAYLVELDATTSPALIYGWIDVLPNKVTKIRFGRFYYPFGLEYTTPPSRFDTINPTLTLWNLLGFSRDNGVQLSQNFNSFKYALAFMNGADNQTSDDNEGKDIFGRFVYQGIKDLDVGLSFQVGKVGTTEADCQRIGAELSYVWGNFGLKSEYIRATDNNIKKWGWYVQPSLWVNSSLQGVVRFEYWDPNTQTAANRQTITTLGVNAFFNPKAKLQINYEIKREEAEVENDALLLQLQLML